MQLVQEEPIAAPSSVPVQTPAMNLRTSFYQISELLKLGDWNKKTYPKRPIQMLIGLSNYGFRDNIELRELPGMFKDIEQAMKDVLWQIENTRWKPSHFHNVMAAMDWIHSVLLHMALPTEEEIAKHEPKEEEPDAPGAQEHEFIPGSGNSRDCGSPNVREHYEGFDPEPLGAEDGSGSDPEGLPASL